MVKLYSKGNSGFCPQCKMTKRLLKELDIPYKEVDVIQDKEAYSYITGLGFSSVPILEVDGQYIKGFQPNKIKEIKEKILA